MSPKDSWSAIARMGPVKMGSRTNGAQSPLTDPDEHSSYHGISLEPNLPALHEGGYSNHALFSFLMACSKV